MMPSYYDGDHLRKTTRCIAVRNSSRERQPSLGTEIKYWDNLAHFKLWLCEILGEFRERHRYLGHIRELPNLPQLLNRQPRLLKELLRLKLAMKISVKSGQSLCVEGIVHLRPRYDSPWVCLHRSELGDIVAVLLLRDHPHVLVLVFLVAAPSNLVNVIMFILQIVGP